MGAVHKRTGARPSPVPLKLPGIWSYRAGGLSRGTRPARRGRRAVDERTTDASTTQGSGAPRLDLRSGAQRTFAHVLVNALLVSVVNYTLWFALTFWVYLETRSVFATGVIAGIFLVATASTGIWFGSIVDHHHKRRVLQASAATSLVIYLGCLVGYLLTPPEAFRDPARPQLWTLDRKSAV